VPSAHPPHLRRPTAPGSTSRLQNFQHREARSTRFRRGCLYRLVFTPITFTFAQTLEISRETLAVGSPMAAIGYTAPSDFERSTRPRSPDPTRLRYIKRSRRDGC
jgi:hypothetical protein